MHTDFIIPKFASTFTPGPAQYIMHLLRFDKLVDTNQRGFFDPF